MKSNMSNSLLLLDVPGTILGTLAGEAVGVSLDGERVEDLHHFAEVDGLHQVVDLVVVEIVAEDEQHLVDVLGLSQAHDQVAQVDEPGVDLYTSTAYFKISFMLQLKTRNV